MKSLRSCWVFAVACGVGVAGVVVATEGAHWLSAGVGAAGLGFALAFTVMKMDQAS